MTIRRFDPETIEQVKSYVYALCDPDKAMNDPTRYFYIGKGTGNRCFMHARDELKKDELDNEQLKLRRVRDIRTRTGKEPEVVIVAYGLGQEAFQLESI